MDVSIIVPIYNPHVLKLERTIKSCVCQEGVSYEIIITDDGSNCDPTNIIKGLFNKYEYENYKIIINKENVGIVKNILNAMKSANGEYVFLTSPGDMIFDKDTINKFYRFAKERNADICFGDSVNYTTKNDEVKIIEQWTAPSKNKVYDKKRKNSFTYYKMSFFLGDYVLGATYFRKRTSALKYFEIVSEYAVFVEDSTSTAFALADGISLFHYNEKICWYECDTGISSGKSSEWLSKLNTDFRNTYNALEEKYPDDQFLDIRRIMNNKSKSERLRLYEVFKKYPKMYFVLKRVMRSPRRDTESSPDLYKKLKSML